MTDIGIRVAFFGVLNFFAPTPGIGVVTWEASPGKIIFRSIAIHLVLRPQGFVEASISLTLGANTKRPANFFHDAYEPFLWIQVNDF